MPTLAELDHAHLWHPFTPMRAWLDEPPLIIERAQGHYLIDTEGNRYLDGVSSLWVNVHGHGHPHLDAAVRTQLDRVAHSTLLGLSNVPSIRLAEKLQTFLPPGLARIFLSDSGSTAVEVALKMAFQYHQLGRSPGRTKFLALRDAYHGDTIGSVSLGGIDTFHRIFHPLLFHTVQARPDIADFTRTFHQHRDSLCAVILEPLVQGAAGIRLAPPGLLAAAATLCRQHDVLLIADEVATGFGRTGTMFACEQEAVSPDFLCMAKGLSGGYLPVAATATTDAVFQRFLGPPDGRLTFFHGHSFGGNPLACAAAVASLELFERDRPIEKLPAKIEQLRERLDTFIKPLPHVTDIRQRGLMIGIELARKTAAGTNQPFPENIAIGARVCQEARKHGVLLRPLGPVVVLMPPLSITPDEIDLLVRAAARAIDVVTTAVATEISAANSSPTNIVRGRAPATPRGLFVAGTDTAVGKTTFSRALLRLALRRGQPMIPCKPVETGVDGQPHDAVALRNASGTDVSLDRVCRFRYPAPAAPSVAAQLAGASLTVTDLVSACLDLASLAAQAPLLVESAGGLLTPISPHESFADLAQRLRLPIVLIARNALGTINHTALTVSALRVHGLQPAAIILVETSPDASPDRTHNCKAIADLTGITPMGILPYLPDADDEHLADALTSAIDVDRLFAILFADPFTTSPG